MVKVHTDEHEFVEDLDRLEGEVMQDEAADEVHVWESDRSHFHGRTSGEAHIGLSSEELGEVEESAGQEIVDYVLAHELGHDLHHEIYGLQVDALDPESDVQDGKLQYDKGNGDLESLEDIPGTMVDIVTGEMVAELAAEENTTVNDPLRRDPFPEEGEEYNDEIQDQKERRFYGQKGEQVVKDLRNNDPASEEYGEIIDNLPFNEFSFFSATDDEGEWHYGPEAAVEYTGSLKAHHKFESDEGIHDDKKELEYHLNLLNDINNTLRRDEVDMEDVVKVAWSDKVNCDNQIDTQDDIFTKEVNQRLEDFDYEDNIPRRQKDIYESHSQADEVIEEQINEIVDNAVERSVDRIAGVVEKVSEGYNQTTPSYGHITAEMDSEEVGDNIEFDYPHKIGCTLGQLLEQNGVELDDVREHPDQYRNIAYQAVEEANRIGHQYNQTGIEPEREDFEQAMNYVIEEEIAG